MNAAGPALTPRVTTDAAREAAFLALMDALACAWQALQDPACTQVLGALVPGATMAFGARVPGTSYQLDPVQAAFNIGTLVSWSRANDPALATASGHLSDNLGAILAVADYRARLALAQGGRVPTVRDLLDALIHAQQLASLEWARTLHENPTTSAHVATVATASAAARCALARIASAGAAASLLGGTEAEVSLAIDLARFEAVASGHGTALPGGPGSEGWRIGDASSRGLRLALIALASPAAAQSAVARPDTETDRSLAELSGLEQVWRAAGISATAQAIRDRFVAGAVAHFPAKQAARLSAMFADRTQLEPLSINQLVSLTTRN